MALKGWIIDKSAIMRLSVQAFADQIDEIAGNAFLCPMGQLEYLYSARSADDYDRSMGELAARMRFVDAPPDVLLRALTLQRDLAHHHGLWHRTPIGDLVIAETALFHELGVVHVDKDYERIATVRPELALRRLEAP